MTCQTCKEMRDDWLKAMIDLDAKRVARLTGEGLRHMARRKPDQPNDDQKDGQ